MAIIGAAQVCQPDPRQGMVSIVCPPFAGRSLLMAESIGLEKSWTAADRRTRGPSRRSAGVLAALCLWGLAAGAQAGSRLPTEAQAAARLDQLAELDRRVAAIGWRLATANTELCGGTRPQPGLVLHAPHQYGPRLRREVQAVFRADPRPRIQAVAPDSPADRARLRRGDVIAAVNGFATQTTSAAQPSGRPRYDEVRSTLRALDDALRLGAARLSLVRQGAPVEVDLEPRLGCDVVFQLIPDARLRASADVANVFVTSGLVQYVSSDDELALLLGHELAHIALGHVDARGRRALNLKARLDRERAADRFGLYLMARAGYDVSQASGFWRRLAADKPLLSLSQVAHGRPMRRAEDIAAATEEIGARVAKGERLDPRLNASP